MYQSKNEAINIYQISPQDSHFIIVNAFMTQVYTDTNNVDRKRKFQYFLEEIVLKYNRQLELAKTFCNTDRYNGTFFLLVIRALQPRDYQSIQQILFSIIDDINKIKRDYPQALQSAQIYKPEESISQENSQFQDNQNSASRDQSQIIHYSYIQQNIQNLYRKSSIVPTEIKKLNPNNQTEKTRKPNQYMITPNYEQYQQGPQQNLKSIQQNDSDLQEQQQIQEPIQQNNVTDTEKAVQQRLQQLEEQFEKMKLEIQDLKKEKKKSCNNCNNCKDINQKIDQVDISELEKKK